MACCRRPGRIVNAVFLYHAVQHGLDAAIFHAARVLPLNRIDPEEIRLAEDLIFNRRRASARPAAGASWNISRAKRRSAAGEGRKRPSSPEERLRAAVLNGNAAGMESDLDLLAAKMPRPGHRQLPPAESHGRGRRSFSKRG